MTTLKMSKDLNNTILKELISSLRSHEIKLKEDEPHKKVKFVALKSKGKFEKARDLQAEEEVSKESSKEEEELSLISKRANQL